MNTSRICPICDEGRLTLIESKDETEYRGHKAELPFLIARCGSCGAEIAGEDEARANKREVTRFRKSVDGLLSGAEIKAIRERYGITQSQAARLFGGGPVAFSKYEHDDIAHAEAMDSLLRLVSQSVNAFYRLAVIKGMEDALRDKMPNAFMRYVAMGPANTNMWIIPDEVDNAVCEPMAMAG